jgi:ATP-dependent DNA helicase RecG
MSERIFISSVQKELQAERQAVREFVRGDPLLRRFFDLFLFEDLPASDRQAEEVYLDEVARCDVYLGLFGNEYGSEDAASPQAPVEYELPREAVAEAIVNAVAHRDYTSNASVQVMLFADRLEIWNPGELPPGLTLAQLRRPHASIPHNPLISEPLFLAHYIERAGTGTLDMITLCREAGLSEPEFRQDGGQFVQTLWRDWLTTKVLLSLGLNERQQQAMVVARQERRLTNARYREVTGASRPTAKRDLEELVSKGLLRAVGSGRGAYYQVPSKRLINGSNGSPEDLSGNGS